MRRYGRRPKWGGRERVRDKGGEGKWERWKKGGIEGKKGKRKQKIE